MDEPIVADLTAARDGQRGALSKVWALGGDGVNTAFETSSRSTASAILYGLAFRLCCLPKAAVTLTQWARSNRAGTQ